MSRLDLAYALSAKDRDQFHVPGKEPESVSFFGFGMLAGLTGIGPFLVQRNPTNVAILLGIGIFALASLARGIQQRRYRLRRVRAVQKLKGRLASTNTPHPLPPST